MSAQRKQPRCRTCGSLMKGHVRGACASPSRSPSPRVVSNPPKPVMPGAYGGRPASDISLLSRLGPKLEETPERVSVPLRGEPTWLGFDHEGDGSSWVGIELSTPGGRNKGRDVEFDRSLARRTNFSFSDMASSISSSFIATPLTGLLQAADAVPLATVFKVATKYVPFIEHNAAGRGIPTGVVDYDATAHADSDALVVVGLDKTVVDQTMSILGSPQREISSPDTETLVTEIRRSRKGCCVSLFQLMVTGAVGGIAMFYALNML
ncbi:hypothetical protein BD410DRAFT_823524 [Rickenella mellea]|uniref:Uncharacterized protein n=1 Tax=Rickenella mellea TaxID=50990 RepID=A0A4R5XE58_9AGAM|nr:hypothetical protein BD410DRAFT_823524 [Rickenella mellea]